MDKCYATGSVTAVDNYVGGLIGYEQKSTISNCYATGAVTGDASIGGLIGISDAATIDDCFSTGAPTGNLHVGGLIGEHSSTVTNCFWDTETSGTETSSAGTGKTTAQMKLIATFSDWSIALAIPDENNGYPYLGWQIDESDTWLIYGLSPRPTTPILDKVTLEAMRNLEMSARGRFRVDKEGNATYKSRYARNA